MSRLPGVLWTVAMLTGTFLGTAAPVTVVHDQGLSGPALHGLEVLESTLEQAGAEVTRSQVLGEGRAVEGQVRV